MQTQKIFLASSSELKEDRKEFEIFIHRKNKEWVGRGVFLDLIMWEDFLDAVSKTRLQDEYNKAIRECDVFVMLFFTKVGPYTAEEFETAFGQFQATCKPFIFTYFKDAEISTGSANRNDLTSLWAFQDKLNELGHFQTVFKNTEGLLLHFDQQLDKLVASGFMITGDGNEVAGLVDQVSRARAGLQEQGLTVDYQTLKTAIQSGHVANVVLLLRAGLSPDWIIDGHTPLNLALLANGLAAETMIGVLQALLSTGKLPQSLGLVVHNALEKRLTRDLVALLRAGTQIHIRDTGGQSLAARAMRMDDQVGPDGQNWTALLMEEAVDLSLPATLPLATWVLLWSAATGRRRIVEILLRKSVPVDSHLDGSLPNEIVHEGELRYWWPGGTALHFAIDESFLIARLLLDRGASPNARDGLGRTPMYVAAQSNAVASIRLLLQWNADPTILDESGNSPLVAAGNLSPSTVKLFMKATAAPDRRETIGLLHKALYERHVELVDLLLESGVDPNAEHENCPSALFRLTYWWKSQSFDESRARRCLELLLNHGAKVGMTDDSGTTALHWIVADADVDEVQKLLDAGADPNAADNAGRTPLMQCASQSVAVRLIAAGASITQCDQLGFNAVDWATMRGLSELATEFGCWQAEPSPAARLVAAIHARRRDEVAKLLSSGVGPDTVDGYRSPVIHLAAFRAFPEILALLLDKGAEVDNRDPDGRTALGKCINRFPDKTFNWAEHDETLRLLLDRGASPTSVDRRGDAAIFLGWVWWRMPGVSQRLLEACYASQSSQSKTALMAAVERGTLEQVERLIEKGCDLDATDLQGWTALFWAVSRYAYAESDEILAMAKLLLESGASVEPRDRNGETPLFAAARCAKPKMASLLIENGASVTPTDNNGETALFGAVRCKRAEALSLLLEAGAEIKHVNRDGLSLREVALRSNNAEFVNRLGSFVS